MRPYYRPYSFNKNERNGEKQAKKNNWFKNHNNKKQYAAVMFVDATPNDQLLKLFRHIEDTHKISDLDRIKFVSKSGMKLCHLVQKKDPFESNCEDKNCKPSIEAESRGTISKCKSMNIAYMAKCKTCKQKGNNRVYYGETARNLHIRSREHYKDSNDPKKKSWMRKHIENEHRDDCSNCDFEWKVISKLKKPMLRQLSEAVHINNTKKNELLNLKNEYFKNNINALQLENSEEEITCRACGRIFDTKSEFRDHFTAVHNRFGCRECDYKSFGMRDLNTHMQIKHAVSDIQMSEV